METELYHCHELDLLAEENKQSIRSNTITKWSDTKQLEV